MISQQGCWQMFLFTSHQSLCLRNVDKVRVHQDKVITCISIDHINLFLLCVYSSLFLVKSNVLTLIFFTDWYFISVYRFMTFFWPVWEFPNVNIRTNWMQITNFQMKINNLFLVIIYNIQDEFYSISTAL